MLETTISIVLVVLFSIYGLLTGELDHACK